MRVSDFSITGSYDDWANFFRAASLNGAIEHLCVDVVDGVLFTSAEVEKGRHIWAMVQSWLFEVVGTGNFVVKTSHVLDALKLMKQGKRWDAIIDPDVNMLIFGNENGGKVKLALLSYKDHTDPNYAGSSYVLPKPEVNNQRWTTRLVLDSGAPIPMPAYKYKSDPYEPWDQLISVPNEGLQAQLRAAKDISSDYVTLSTDGHSEFLNVFLESGRQIGKATNNAKLTSLHKIESQAVLPGAHEWSYDYDRSHLETVLNQNNGGSTYIAMSSHEEQSNLWVGFHISGDKKDAVTMACYYIGNIAE